MMHRRLAGTLVGVVGAFVFTGCAEEQSRAIPGLSDGCYEAFSIALSSAATGENTPVPKMEGTVLSCDRNEWLLAVPFFSDGLHQPVWSDPPGWLAAYCEEQEAIGACR